MLIRRMRIAWSRARWASASLALLAMATLATPALADVDDETRGLIDRWLEATGGREAFEAESTVYVRARIEAAQMKGHWKLWLAKPDRWVLELKLGPLNFRHGFDGETAWRTDLSQRSVTLLEGPELDEARDAAYFYHERWAEPDQAGGKVRAGSRSFGAEGTRQALQITPPSGGRRHLMMNRKTGLIDVTQKPVGHWMAEEFWSGYETRAGRKRPTKYTWSRPHWVETLETMRVDSVRVNDPLDPAMFSPPELTGRKITWLKNKGAARIPFSYGTKHVWIRVSVNGSPPGNFLLDTGASLTAIDRAWAEQNGLLAEGDSRVTGIAGVGRLAFAKVKSLRVSGKNGDGVQMSDFRAGLVDLGQGMEASLWRHCAGLLGHDFLSRFAVEIDYDDLVVTFRDPASWTPPDSLVGVPMTVREGGPTIDMTLEDGCAGRFLLDVGNGGHLAVHGSAVRPCNLLRRKREMIETGGGGIGGGYRASTTRLDSLAIGPWTLHEPIAQLTLVNRGGLGSQDIAGNIGNALLEKFRCTFDYERNMLWLSPGRRFTERDVFDRWGAFLVREPGKVWVGGITPRTSAADAGLRLWDEVLAINDKPIMSWTREEIDAMLEEGAVGAVFRVRVKRRYADDEETLEVTLRDAL